MATTAQGRPQVNGVARRQSAPRAPIKKPYQPAATQGKKAMPNGAARAPPRTAPPQKSASIAGESPHNGVTSAYAIMASRIANRVAEMAESITFVERPKPQEPELTAQPEERKRPRKLDIRLNNGSSDHVAFSAPFLDNTLQKMLQLQNRMLKTTADLAKAENVDEKVIKEQAAQAAELSRIIALICAEKARQGA
ncbi:hypothetical protein CLAFUW4_08961 [Fulvia fulva]|uniref:Uncharacterized protein n=1 Tax=Passalora fulva TaxID=5499 RepID=A0A9Q8PFY8_PASFU|nr:uncharacterized protein CLAFUR5_09069 [Fulvia fulva]KAK4614227.1 hypothetical protein CLAFUR4_08967 [Fulvia fulva]KAK4614636.1 hypothetical protein CLAFUR0_08959 [Fulvia fulva]UJO21721.1 hypothetical protein CLAFUR5_09069 [Fulvia fulva]WPV20676.1 hypothetical protein CLAFUW4_08961 [Fulvia fulva]WPV35733.1 hypothetical protein CLAFUW7_08962 [Fulvia fulva]